MVKSGAQGKLDMLRRDSMKNKYRKISARSDNSHYISRLFLEHTAITETQKWLLAEKVFETIWETNVTVGRIKVTY